MNERALEMRSVRDILVDLKRRQRDLGMPIGVLAELAGISVSTVKRILGGNPQVAFASVLALADALGMGDLSNGESVSVMRQRQAEAKAEKLVGMVQGTSSLEGQAVDDSATRNMVDRTVVELLKGSSAALWAR